MGIVGNLTADQLQSFNSQGYIVLESFATDDDIDAMVRRMDQLVNDFDPSSTASIFSTKNQQKLTDDYFFESAEKISFFFEEKAFGDDGKLKQPKQLSLNKVGHDSVQRFTRLSRHSRSFLLPTKFLVWCTP